MKDLVFKVIQMTRICGKNIDFVQLLLSLLIFYRKLFIDNYL